MTDLLTTTDLAAASVFYERAFGWTALLSADGSTGVLQLDDGTAVAHLIAGPAEGRAQWLPLVRVADLDDVCTRMTKLGATVHNGPIQIPGGECRLVVDPLGAVLALQDFKKGN